MNQDVVVSLAMQAMQLAPKVGGPILIVGLVVGLVVGPAISVVFSAVDTLIASFPNPAHHGSHVNHHHVNDWTLPEVERQLDAAVRERFARMKIGHLHQPAGTSMLVEGRAPDAPFWVFLVRGDGTPEERPAARTAARKLNLPR